MIEYELTIGGQINEPQLITPPLSYKDIFVEDRNPDLKKKKLLNELRYRLNELNPNITSDRMVCSIQETLELSDDELRKIIPEGSSLDHITDSFLGLWYMASISPETFAQDIRIKHKEHASFESAEPASHLDLIFQKGVGPVLMEYYEIFKPDLPRAERAPLSPVQ